MDLYLFCLGLSFCGLLVMALAGLSHHQSQGHGHGGHAHGGHGHGHGPAGGFQWHKGAVGHQHGHSHSHAHSHGNHHGWENASALLLGLFSPRILLSMLLGFGATGLILGPVISGSPALLLLLAVIGGWSFEQFVMRPFWKFLFGFASNPGLTLNSTVLHESTAATDFDADGRGLVSLELDGQVRQVLGRLCPEERAQSTGRVRTGERLVIQAVDDRSNTCTVSRARVSC